MTIDEGLDELGPRLISFDDDGSEYAHMAKQRNEIVTRRRKRFKQDIREAIERSQPEKRSGLHGHTTQFQNGFDAGVDGYHANLLRELGFDDSRQGEGGG